MEPVVIDAYAPALSTLAERVLVYLQEDEQVQVGFADVWKICKKIRASFDDVKDAIYEIRKKESFFVKKITDEQRNDIIEKAKKGWSQNAIAKEYGVSQGAISFILRNYKPAAEQPENPTQAPESTIETGAISSVVLADTTSEQNPTESADAVQPITEIEQVAEPVVMTEEHTAETSSIPQVVAYAVEDRIANIMGYVEKLEEKRAALERAIDTLQQDISGYKAEIEELRAWMGSHTIAGDA